MDWQPNAVATNVEAFRETKFLIGNRVRSRLYYGNAIEEWIKLTKVRHWTSDCLFKTKAERREPSGSYTCLSGNIAA